MPQNSHSQGRFRGKKHTDLAARVLKEATGTLRPALRHYTDGQLPIPFPELDYLTQTPAPAERVAKRFARAFEHYVCALLGGERGKQVTIFPDFEHDAQGTRHVPDVLKHRRDKVVNLYEVKSLQPSNELQIKEHQWRGYEGLERAFHAPASFIIFRHTQQGLGTPVFDTTATPSSTTKRTKQPLSALSDHELYAHAGGAVLSALEVPYSVLRWLGGVPGLARHNPETTREAYVAFASTLLDALFAQPRQTLQSRDSPHALPLDVFADLRIEHRKTLSMTLWAQPFLSIPFTRIRLPYQASRLERIEERLANGAYEDTTRVPF
jgi:hypothetical protein